MVAGLSCAELGTAQPQLVSFFLILISLFCQAKPSLSSAELGTAQPQLVTSDFVCLLRNCKIVFLNILVCLLGRGKKNNKKKQAGAELCQAQHSLS